MDKFDQAGGGQRQRIVMALAMEPRLRIADEPTTALDVTTQAQILSMFKQLKETHKAGILFVTHDFDVVAAEISGHILVMQKGVAVEYGTVDEVFGNPQNGYTRQLLAAMPGRGREVPDIAALGPAIPAAQPIPA
ncbi:ABC transporter ATP-binding protein [Pannonibacter indicus]|uniref:Oligopeptide/dipeptide transporter, C-terminal region n=1 Tax=Pannonibacter indicus TaxID=466044 RepID=A0A0K6HYG5_9HYPH|nr:Oligopeptide/dipeptide transporter, C-terminal region [Pannonibacter indicus]